MNPPSSPTVMHQLRVAISTFVRDVARGVLTLTHSGLAMLGLVLVLGLGGAVFRPDLLSEAETSVYAFLRPIAPQPPI
jgi:uncharacterized membrane protein